MQVNARQRQRGDDYASQDQVQTWSSGCWIQMAMLLVVVGCKLTVWYMTWVVEDGAVVLWVGIEFPKAVGVLVMCGHCSIICPISAQ